MSGVALIISGEEMLARVAEKLNAAGRRMLLGEMLDGVGALVASQTQRRIAEEKRGPDGKAWKPWSEETARRRSGTQSLLFYEGHLAGSIDHEVAGDEVRVGSGLVYAAIHQFGGKAGRGRQVEIPARPYLGLSDENRDEIEAVVTDWLEEVLAA